MRPSLPKCDFLGPPAPGDDEVNSLPSDWTGNPFDYLPDSYNLTEEEADLAARYRDGDMSGGYLQSQIAYFRAPRPIEQHKKRRSDLEVVEAQAAEVGVVLPSSFKRLAASDDFVDRIRHNTIWFDIFPSLVDCPSSPGCKLLQAFREGQGCDHWSLLMIPDGSHLVVYHSESLDIDGNYPVGWKPDLKTFEFFQCASSFDEWLAVYFSDCVRGDRHYAEMLEKYPGI